MDTPSSAPVHYSQMSMDFYRGYHSVVSSFFYILCVIRHGLGKFDRMSKIG